MRLIGHLNSESGAKTFGDYLTTIDIRNLVEPDSDGTWAIWVHNEDQIAAGEAALQDFRRDPSSKHFQGARERAAAVEKKERDEARAAQKRVYTSSSVASGIFGRPATLTMLCISVVTTLITWADPNARYWLFFSLPDIMRGEVWRLITPIFMHGTIIHLLFNMIMLRDLGGFLEGHLGLVKYLIITIVLAIASNFCQYLLSGYNFLGFSGVLYGYFGYLWIRSKVDPNSGLGLSPNWVMTMLIWYVVCWTGLLGPVANWAHTGGLVAGAAWGALPLIIPASRRF